jgi:hypothetical protein
MDPRSTRPLIAALGVALLALASAACGGDDGDGSAPRTDAATGSDTAADLGPGNVDAGGGGGADAAPPDASLPAAIRASKWSALTDPDKRVSCDFFVAQVGGYGKDRICPDGTSIGSLFESQNECLAAMTACDAKVAEVESCYAAQAQHGCAEDLPDECQNLTGTCI